MTIEKIQKAIFDSREVVVHLKSQLHWYLLKIRTDTDPESLEFYSRLQDHNINIGKAYPRGKGIGYTQLEFGKRMGLSPDETMIDIGCGDFQAGRHFIEYLDSGNYYGMDISGEAINAAKKTSRNMTSRTRTRYGGRTTTCGSPSGPTQNSTSYLRTVSSHTCRSSILNSVLPTSTAF